MSSTELFSEYIILWFVASNTELQRKSGNKTPLESPSSFEQPFSFHTSLKTINEKICNCKLGKFIERNSDRVPIL